MSGSWNTIEAIISRWEAKGLNANIAAMWSDPSEASHYPVLHEDMAREGTPKPYVVFEITPHVDQEQMSCAESGKVFKIGALDINFRVHAVDKSQAVSVAKLIVDAFDNAGFSAGESYVLGMARTTDFGARDEDDGYLWSIRYRIKDSHKEVVST